MFSEVLGRVRELLDSGQPLLISAEVRADGDDVRLMAQEVELLDQAVAQAAAGLRVFLHDAAPIGSLKSVLARDERNGGRAKVAFVLGLDDGQEVEMELPGGFRLTPQLRQAIKAIPGVVVQDF